MDNIHLIREIGTYLGKNVGDEKIKLPRTNSLFNHIPDTHKRKDELRVYLTNENKLFIYSFQESHHN